jgi:hypothetical protein
MKEFIKKLLCGDSNLSSKRFGALLGLVSALVVLFIATIKQKGLCPEYMFSGILLLVGSLFGINGIENIMKSKKED